MDDVHENIIGKLCIQSVGSTVPHIMAMQYARPHTLLHKVYIHLTKTSDFYFWLIFGNGIWQRWCHFVFFQTCNLNASRMNNDIMNTYTKCTRLRLLRDTKVTNIDQKQQQQKNMQTTTCVSIKNRVTSQDPLKENLFRTFCAITYTYVHSS